jgi:hypothetical protein
VKLVLPDPEERKGGWAIAAITIFVLVSLGALRLVVHGTYCAGVVIFGGRIYATPLGREISHPLLLYRQIPIGLAVQAVMAAIAYVYYRQYRPWSRLILWSFFVVMVAWMIAIALVGVAGWSRGYDMAAWGWFRR